MFQLLGLHQWHNYNSFTVYAKKGPKGSYIFDSFATPGFSYELFGKPGDLTRTGDLIMTAVKQSFYSKFTKLGRAWLYEVG